MADQTDSLTDPDPDVRRRVADRIAPEHLPAMMRDEDSYVRWLVAERIPNIPHLPIDA